MGVSKNSGTPKSSILIGFSIINHPFWGTPNTHIYTITVKELVFLGYICRMVRPQPGLIQIMEIRFDITFQRFTCETPV